MFLVLTLGLIGTWQVFDQIYVMSQGNPAKTTLTPAFLSYRTAFRDFDYGSGAAISFVLFLIIVVLTLVQRWVMRDRTSPATPAVAAAHGRRVMTAVADRATGGAVDRAPLAAPIVGYAVLSSSRWCSSTRSSSSSRTRSRPSRTRPPTRCRRSRTRSPPAAFERIFDGTDFPLLAGQLGAGDRAGHRRPGVLRLAGRLRAGPAALPGPAALFAAVIAVMAVPGVVLLIPKFLVLNQLGHLRQLRRR